MQEDKLFPGCERGRIMVILAAAGEKHNPKEIIKTGNDLATAFQDELQVLHVIPRDDAQAHMEELRNIPEFKDYSMSAEADRAKEVARTLINATLDDVDADRVIPVGRVGDPTDEIMSMVDATDPEYLVIGGRKRSPTGKALFGSVTQSVILNSDHPVVTVLSDS